MAQIKTSLMKSKIFDNLNYRENIVDEYSIINFKQMFNPQPVKNGRHIRNKTFSLDNKYDNAI